MLTVREIICPHLPGVDGILMDIWELPSQARVDLNVIASIGYQGGRSHDDFYTKVITGIDKEAYLEKFGKIPYDGKVFFFPSFDPVFLESFLTDLINSCDRGNWDDSLVELRKLFFWEYEGMD